MKFKTSNEIVNNHPYINSCMVIDIETDSLNPLDAKMVWFGAYSYKYNKYYVGTPDDHAHIQKLIDDHKVLIGWNNKAFDGPIMENPVNKYDLQYKIIFDGMQVLHNTRNRRDNRKPIIKLQNGLHLDAACKTNKLRDVGAALGCSVVKGDIDYKIFRQDSWTEKEVKDIEHYLFGDVALTREIFEYMVTYFDSFRDMVDSEDVRKFNYIRSSTGSFAYSAISKAIGLKPVYPSGPRPPHTPFTGAFVLEPTKDYAENVIYFDFASLYPHVELMCNLFSPDIKDYRGKVWVGDGFFETKGIYMVDKQGVTELALKKIMDKRLALKAMNDPSELGYKIIINSIYGISSVPIFLNVYNPTVAPDTTGISQQIIKFAIKTFEKYGFGIIAADTDSCFVELGDKDNFFAKRVADEISQEILSHVPFPVDTFKMNIEDSIMKIWFPGKKKKHYAYLTQEGKLKVKGLEFIKNGSSLLGQKMYKYLTPIVEERLDALFEKEYIEEVAMKFVHEDITLVGQMYKVKPLNTYKSKTSIQAQIAAILGEGEFLMVPNNKYGSVGKSKKYILVAKYRGGQLIRDEENIALLKFSDIVLDKFWKEMQVFTKDYVSPETKRQMEKAEEYYQRQKDQMQLTFFESDLFDSEAVGEDISDKEFVENEVDFVRRE